MKSEDSHITWLVTEGQFNPDNQHHKETIFTIGNGYLSTRGTVEERVPGDRQATLIHGMWDDVPIAFTELANSPDWTSLKIWVNDRQFQMSKGTVKDYARYLDLKTGILHRYLTWFPEDEGTGLIIAFERFASLSDQHISAVQLKVTPLSGSCQLRIRAALDTHVENEGHLHWNKEFQHGDPDQIDIVLSTRKSRKLLAMSSVLLVNEKTASRKYIDCPGCPGIEVVIEGNHGETYVFQKLVSHTTSRDAEDPLVYARERLRNASSLGYKFIRKNNLSAWNQFWEISDVIITGDEEAQQAIRHAIFQLRIAAPTHDEKVSIGAKTLSGFGYRGHVFWDTEIFILPLFTLTHPDISRNLLMYRYHTISGARRKAARNGFRGAQFAWESAESGDEVTPTWVPDFDDPLELIRIWTGDIEIHISSDIVYALYQYWQITGDLHFWLNIGIPILFETALYWGDRAEFEDGVYSIRDVIGPDEYHEHVDNNVFTNYLVKWHLSKAVEVYQWLCANYPETLSGLNNRLGLSSEIISQWEDIRDNLLILQNPKTNLFEQFEGFFQLEDIDLTKYGDRTKSMQEILGINGANQHQVLKQADVIMLLCLFSNDFDKQTWQSNWEYYNPRTDHSYGSSLGPSFQAWAACEIGDSDQAYEHFIRASKADLFDVRGNANDGIHAASAGGLWQAVVFGFAGLDLSQNHPEINPRLPHHWDCLTFRFVFQGKKYAVKITQESQALTRI